jgi:hydroxymethylpyrimidine pyrophosphatase-like HAD family hydrolase
MNGKAIRIFVSDIDGCIAMPYEGYDLDGIATLVGLTGKEGSPLLSLCSGRAYPYVEAVSQMLGLDTPVLFESGGGMFDPEKAAITWNPALTTDVEEALLEIKHWLIREIVPGSSLMFDYGKRTQSGVIGPVVDDVMRGVELVERYVSAEYPEFRVFHTHVSIDVVHKAITKKQAMQWMADHLGFDVSEMAFIGDTNGDLEALQLVGRSFAPDNSTPEVKHGVQTVCGGKVIDAVVEAYRTCISENLKNVPHSAVGT